MRTTVDKGGGGAKIGKILRTSFMDGPLQRAFMIEPLLIAIEYYLKFLNNYLTIIIPSIIIDGIIVDNILYLI